jgi:peptide/nickel transport system permease protein
LIVIAAETLTVAAVAIPEFWMGLILILLFHSVLGVAPAPIGRLDPLVEAPDGPSGLMLLDSLMAGNLDAFLSAATHLVLPAVALAFLAFPSIARITSASLRSVLNQDFVMACRANGDRGLQLYRKVVPVALPPVLTNIGIVVGYLIAGDFLLEKVFAWPGVGLYAVTAVQVGDYAAIQAIVLMVAFAYVAVFLLVDAINVIIDPRISR